MRRKIFIACQFSDRWSLLERKLCMLTGRRQFKRTGMKETVKTKWELRMQERKKQQKDRSQSWYVLLLFSAVDRTC